MQAPVQTSTTGDSRFLKPRLRGVVHEVAFSSWLTVGVVLVLVAPGLWARLAVAVYALCMGFMLGASALLHRGNWSAAVERRLGTLDHSGIFLAIAGTYTVVAGVALDGAIRTVVLTLVWAGAIAGVIGASLHLQPPRWILTGTYLVVGWVAVLALPALWHALGVMGLLGVIGGGVLYTSGAVVYARRRPDPWPHVFGYHEIWHALVVVAAILQLAVVAFVVIPGA